MENAKIIKTTALSMRHFKFTVLCPKCNKKNKNGELFSSNGLHSLSRTCNFCFYTYEFKVFCDRC